MKMTEICLVNTWSDRFDMEGKLSLLQVNDTIHVIEYKDNERSITVDVDLVELRTPDSTIRFTFPRGSNDKLVFKVEDDAEFSVLCRAKEECQAICDLKLRLNSVLRDSYFSGVYSNLDPDAKVNLCDEMERLKKENPGVFFSALLNASERKHDVSAQKASREINDENALRLSEVMCVFCDSAKVVCKDLDFVLHPNVSQNSANRPVFMCSVCIENWKDFRENAEHEEQLVLPGEINEEICAVCSDTPESLVLCGECPRSFCNACLAHLLTAPELRELEGSDEDWVCVCCAAGQSRNPPLARTAWKMVLPGVGRRGHAYGMLVPYTKKNQAKVVATQNAAMKVAIDSALLHSPPSVVSAPPAKAAVQAAHAEAKKPGASNGTGRGVRKASYEESEVDPLATLHAANRNSDNNRGKRMEKRQRDLSGVGLAPANPELDEKYYFGQYVGYYNLLCEDVAQRLAVPVKNAKGKRKISDEVPTDDVCFLCKDGGDLIECDWRCPSACNGERCLKVYHEYCLDYAVNDDDWVCPRHFCDMCGSKTLKYICKYCPVSICANCPEKIVNKYGHARYCEVTDALSKSWRHSPTAPGVQSIVCHTCTEMLEVISSTAVESIKISSNSSAGLQGSASVEIMLADLRVQKRFPGIYEGESSGGGSVFRKEPGSTSDNLSASDSFVYSKSKALPAKSKPKVPHTVAAATASSSAGSTSKWSYRRWSDKETSVLRAAVRVHGDNAEAIKNDPQFSEALQFRNAEAIWNKILREALIPSEKNSDASGSENSEDENDDDEEEGKQREKDGDRMVKKQSGGQEKKFQEEQANVGAEVVVKEEKFQKEELLSLDAPKVKPEVKLEETNEVPTDLSTDESAGAIVMVKVEKSRQEEDELTAMDVATEDEQTTTVNNTSLSTTFAPSVDSGPRAVTPSVSEFDAAEEQYEEAEAELDVTPPKRAATSASVRSSSRLSATDASVSTTDSKRGRGQGGRAGRGKGRGGRGAGRGLTRTSPQSADKSVGDSQGGDEEDHEQSSGDEEEPEVPQMVATRGTRRQNEEQVLSTRSGKKLFLTGSDLLPSLN